MATSTPKVFRVGIITGSNRPLRAGPQIAHFVQDVITQHEAAAAAEKARPHIEITPIDIAALNLPFFDEPHNPRAITDPTKYEHAHTRAWSAAISALDAFVMVTPQYNWGVPAGLKNAIDYLWHEWRGKPVLVVSYGGHGGNKAADALALIMGGGIQARVVPKNVNLSFPSREFMITGSMGKDIGLDAKSETGTWADRRADIAEGWDELVKLLETPAPEPAH